VVKVTATWPFDDRRAAHDLRSARGRAEFDQAKQTVVLSDDAVVHDGSNEVSGDRIVVYLNENRSVVEGGSGRVRAVLFPPKSGTPGSEGGS